MYLRTVYVSSVILFVMGCGESDTTPDTSTILTCSELSSAVIACNNGFSYSQVTNGGQAGGGGEGGAGGIGGDGGAGGVIEPVPTEPKYFMCFAPPLYAGTGQACSVDADCPASESGCEIPKCGANSECTTSWVGDGVKACADPSLYCVGSYCCGLVGDPN